ncbi:MAG: NADH-quinone oxidoreductase subunit L [Myxococcota bacterium]
MAAAELAPSLWVIILLPLLGALTCGLLGRTLGRANTALVANMAVAGSFVLSLLVFWSINDFHTSVQSPFSLEPTRYALGWDYGTWFSAGAFRVNFGLWVDHLSGSMLLVITGVGLLIHLYSAGYMAHDEGHGRYFAYLNLFVAMMLLLVMADSMVLLFVGWEGVGLCSYLLIGFWYTDAQKAYCGRKAFVVNRIGDFAFLLGMFLLVLLVHAFERQATPENFGGRGMQPAQTVAQRWKAGLSHAGPLHFRGLEELALAQVELDTPIAQGPLAGFTFGRALTVVLLLFLLGAAGKSAQLPLYVWLPDAMAGPTPVSALIHAATMVTAGVYLFCRVSYLLVLSPTAMAATTLIGAFTALFAALIAFAQDDIKKVLAYSTVSQLGLMFVGAGMGVFWAAFLHVVTHAFFKACLFLGAGSVMHGNADEGNIKKLGALWPAMKWTTATFAVATLAITGIVPLSGFFSKDAILHGVHSTVLVAYPWVGKLAWGLGLGTTAATAFYMSRLFLLTFTGPRAKEARTLRPHESGLAMVLPLVLLAFGSVVLFVQGIPFMESTTRGPKQTVMENFLAPVFYTAQTIAARAGTLHIEHASGLPWGAWGLAWVVALAGGATALALYKKFFPAWAGQPVPALARTAQTWTRNKFYVDEAYDFLIVKPLKFVAFILYKVVDALLIDTVLVRGVAWVTAQTGALLRYVQTGDAQSYAAVMVLALAGALAYVLLRVL